MPLGLHLPDLLISLADIVQEFPRARIFFTTRPHVKEGIQSYFTKAVVIPISPNTEDIRNYVEMRLDKDTEQDAMNDNLRADIVRIVMEEISDMCVGGLSIFTLPMMYSDKYWM